MSVNSSSTISLIAFDLGRVMIRLAGSWEDAAQYAGVTYRPFTGTPDELAALRDLEAKYEIAAISSHDFFEHSSRVLHGLYSPSEFRALFQATIREELPGIAELVQELRVAGYRTACLSNTSEAHWVDLSNPSLYPGIGMLDYQHASHLFGLSKPDPAIYRRFEEVIGARADEILFFDDRPENVQAACDCGWHAQVILPEPTSVEQIRATLAAYGVLCCS